MIFNSRTFWVIVATLVVFVAKFFYPTLPIDAPTLLTAILFVLSLVGVVPTVRAMLAGRALAADLLRSAPFWILVAALLSFVVHFYWPTFPLDEAVIFALVIFVLDQFGITPTVRKMRMLMEPAKPQPLNAKGRQPK